MSRRLIILPLTLFSMLLGPATPARADVLLTPFLGVVFGGDAPAQQFSNVSTVMANVMVAAPMSGARLRPYASGGVGIMHAKATSVGNVFELDENNLGVNVGVGAIGFVGDNVGIRGDLRYFRALQDSEAGDGLDLEFATLSFWRGTLGLVFRF